jgi:hypothetical protein
MTARTGDPSWVARGRVAGATLAPSLIEEGALRIADKVKPKQSRKQRKRSKNLSKALKEASKKARKKNGDFRNGWDQKRLMSTAHRMCKE